jgi:hypothetical protein
VIHRSISNQSMSDSVMTAELSSQAQRLLSTRKKTDCLMCSICEGPAHGYNFNAITCESCKAFFRRNALKSDV